VFLEAWRMIKVLLNETHKLVELDFNIPHDFEESPENYQVMLETDLDPTLIKKWGW
jgi:hypothetical protein